MATTKDFIVKNGLQVLGSGSNASTSTNTGALQVVGGVGVGGNLYGTALYDNSNRVVTSVSHTGGLGIGIASQITTGTSASVTINNVGVLSLNGSTGTVNVQVGTYLGISTSSGVITLNNAGVTQVNGSTGSIVISAGTDTAISTATGSVVVYSTATLNSIMNRTGGNTSSQYLVLNSTSASSNTSTGALIVQGGVGIGGSVYAGPMFSNGAQVLTTATIGSFGVTSLNGNTGAVNLLAGSDTVITTATGSITIANTSTLQSVTNRGNATSNPIQITNTTADTGTNTANALYVAGGAWIGKTLLVSGATTFKDTVTFSGTATYVYSTNTVYTDNILELHTPPGGVATNWTVDDGKDIGLRFHYFTNSTDTNAALVLANDTKWLEWYGSGAESTSSSIITSATYGTFKTGAIVLASTASNHTSSATNALIVAGGIGAGGSIYSASTMSGLTVLDNGNRVITGVSHTGGPGIGIASQTTTGPSASVTINNVGVLSLNGSTGTVNVLGSAYIGVTTASGSVTITNGGVTQLNGSTGTLNITAGTDTAISTATGSVVVYSTATLNSIMNRTGGNTSSQYLVINNTSASSNTSTGALIVQGGVGIGGNLYVGGTFSASSVTIGGSSVSTGSSIQYFGNALGSGVTTFNFATGTTATVTGSVVTIQATGAVSSLVGGTDTIVTSVGGAYTVYSTATLQSITSRTGGNTTNATISITNSTVGTSTSTGQALLVTGGIGASLVTATNVWAVNLQSGSGSWSSYTSPVISSSAQVTLDTFSTSTYRTAKYTIQIVDTGTIPNKVHCEEMLLMHDAFNTAYLNNYGLVFNTTELGTFDASFAGGLISLLFTPNYVPTTMTIKVVKTNITV